MSTLMSVSLAIQSFILIVTREILF